MQYFSTPTPYCWPITDLDSLQAAAVNLRSRVIDRITDPEIRGISVSHAVDETLRGIDHSADDDGTGRRVLFINLLSPLSRRETRHTDINNTPLLISVLLPDLAFNISEVESAYDFSIQNVLEQQFSGGYIEQCIVHKNSLYITTFATFHILSLHHPALLISLSYGSGIPNLHSDKILEVFRQIREYLGSVHTTLIDNCFSETLSYEIIEEAYRACTTAISQSQEHVAHLISPEEEVDTSSGGNEWHLRHLISEALCSLLTDERLTFDYLHERNAKYSEEADDEETPIGEEQSENPTLECLLRMRRLIVSVRNRLRRLSRAFSH